MFTNPETLLSIARQRQQSIAADSARYNLRKTLLTSLGTRKRQASAAVKPQRRKLLWSPKPA